MTTGHECGGPEFPARVPRGRPRGRGASGPVLAADSRRGEDGAPCRRLRARLPDQRVVSVRQLRRRERRREGRRWSVRTAPPLPVPLLPRTPGCMWRGRPGALWAPRCPVRAWHAPGRLWAGRRRRRLT